MNPEKYTERCKGFIQSAQTYVLNEGHPRFEPLHLLKTLLDDPQGLAANLVTNAGGDIKALSAALKKNYPVLGKFLAQGRSL